MSSEGRKTRGCPSVENYEVLRRIGDGQYGEVFVARNKQSGEVVALKKFKLSQDEKEGFPMTAIREIKLLSSLNCENVVKVKEIVTSPPTASWKRPSAFMVMEFCEFDLAHLLSNPSISFSEPQIKCYMKQLLNGLFHCHSAKIMHRDMKSANILLTGRGVLKIADFGLSKIFNADHMRMTPPNRIVTLWYRAPELLLGSMRHTPAIDMWSAGCIFAELYVKRPIFRGENPLDQLKRIFQVCGSPTEDTWKGVSDLPDWATLGSSIKHEPALRTAFKKMPSNALDLLERLLCLDPTKRITAHDALNHDYFWSDPLPQEPGKLPQYQLRKDVKDVLMRPPGPGLTIHLSPPPAAPPVGGSSNSGPPKGRPDPRTQPPPGYRPGQAPPPSSTQPPGPPGSSRGPPPFNSRPSLSGNPPPPGASRPPGPPSLNPHMNQPSSRGPMSQPPPSSNSAPPSSAVKQEFGWQGSGPVHQMPSRTSGGSGPSPAAPHHHRLPAPGAPGSVSGTFPGPPPTSNGAHGSAYRGAPTGAPPPLDGSLGKRKAPGEASSASSGPLSDPRMSARGDGRPPQQMDRRDPRQRPGPNGTRDLSQGPPVKRQRPAVDLDNPDNDL